MRTPTTITRLDVRPLDIPLEKPFGIAGGAQELARNALVTIELADGTIGYGEAAPFPAFNGETQPRAIAAIEAARPAVLGADVRAYRRIAAALGEVIGGSGAARCAIETAVFDALARHAGLPLWALFGGAEGTLVTDVTVTVGSADEARADAEAWSARGFSRFKVKVGGARAGEDAARVAAIAAAAPGAEIFLDGNGGLDARAAIALVGELRAIGITPILFEQPVPGDDLAGLAEVARSAGIPVAADESVTRAADVPRLAALGAAQVVNIKLMKCGLVEALAIAEAARAHGLGLMIGGMVEARLAMSASACFAAGLGGFAFVDLDTPLFLAEDPFEGGYAMRGSTLDLAPITRGHGVAPRAR